MKILKRQGLLRTLKAYGALRQKNASSFNMENKNQDKEQPSIITILRAFLF